MPGVARMMLDRIGNEIARATTIVRYAPNSRFSSHVHPGGEEYYVLSGLFADEYGQYPSGTYVRNPIGTKHTPQIGNEGATIFVKLHQFSPEDTAQKVISTQQRKWQPRLEPGLQVMPLHKYRTEKVFLLKSAPNIKFNTHEHVGGEEILVLEGTLYDESGAYPKGSWIRYPHLSRHTPFTKSDGALIYTKTGHLPDFKCS
ncbi:MAG: cupin [Betaproteobacteria bacterium]|jgi:anti-sigma factor ChrR (cupin superfamily)|nr:cupin [Betaproteobacteria bacterium]